MRNIEGYAVRPPYCFSALTLFCAEANTAGVLQALHSPPVGRKTNSHLLAWARESSTDLQKWEMIFNFFQVWTKSFIQTLVTQKQTLFSSSFFPQLLMICMVYLSLQNEIFGKFQLSLIRSARTKICFCLISVQSESRKEIKESSEMTKPDITIID